MHRFKRGGSLKNSIRAPSPSLTPSDARQTKLISLAPYRTVPGSAHELQLLIHRFNKMLFCMYLNLSRQITLAICILFKVALNKNSPMDCVQTEVIISLRTVWSYLSCVIGNVERINYGTYGNKTVNDLFRSHSLLWFSIFSALNITSPNKV